MATLTGGQVVWVFDADTGNFNRAVIEAEKTAKTAASSINKSFSNSFSNSLSIASSAIDGITNGLGKIISMGIAVGVTGGAGIMAMANAAFEQVKAVQNASFGLKAYEKDASKVTETLSELVKYAKSDMGVLFQRQELFKAATNLKVFGVETNKLVDYTKILSKGVALGYTSFEELSFILGRTVSQGKLTGDAFDQLIARGIKLPDSMRGATVSAEELFNALDKSLPAEILEGRANTIDGQMIRLQSAFRNLGASILGVNADADGFVKGSLGDRFLGILEELRTTLKDPAIVEGFTKIGNVLADWAERIFPKVISSILWLGNNIEWIIPIIEKLIVTFVGLKILSATIKLINGVTKAFRLLIPIIDMVKLTMTGYSLASSGLMVASGGFAGFGAKIAGAFGLIRGAISRVIPFLTTILPGAFSTLSTAIMAIPVWGWIIAAIAAIIAVFVVLWNNVDGFKQFFINSWNSIMEGVSKVVEWFKGPFANFFNTVWDNIIKGLNIVGNIFSTIWNGIVEVFTNVFNVIMTVLQPFIDIISLIISVIFGIGQIVFTIFSAIGQIIFTTISTIVQIIGVVLYGTFLWLWNNVLIPTGQFFANVFNGIKNVITTVIGAVVGFITISFNNIKSFITSVWTGISSFTFDVWNKIWGFIGPTVTNIYNWIVSVFTSIKNWLTSAWTAIYTTIIEPIKNAISWFTSKVSEVYEAVIGGIKKGWDWLTQSVSSFTDVGKDMINGLVNGIKANASKVVDAVKNIAKGALDAVKNFFGIKSPSRVMRDSVGKMIGAGLAEGITESQSLINSAITGLNTDFDMSIGVNTNGVDLNATGNPGSLQGVSSSGVTINQTNTVYTELDMNLINRNLTWELGRA